MKINEIIFMVQRKQCFLKQLFVVYIHFKWLQSKNKQNEQVFIMTCV